MYPKNISFRYITINTQLQGDNNQSINQPINQYLLTCRLNSKSTYNNNNDDNNNNEVRFFITAPKCVRQKPTRILENRFVTYVNTSIGSAFLLRDFITTTTPPTLLLLWQQKKPSGVTFT
jgi:hypothetical protein